MGFGVRAPPEKTALVGDDIPATPCLLTVKSPKSAAFPVVAIVTNEIMFVLPGERAPPANRPLVELQAPAADDILPVKSPKS